MKLTKEDFYSGAFLSFLLNNKIVPALFEDRSDMNRKVYDFTTDKGDFRVYVKSSEKPSSENDYNNSSIWNFPFTEGQIDDIKSLQCNTKQFYFVFVCARPELNKSRLAVVPESTVFQCIDVNRKDKYKSQSVKVKLAKGGWNFNLYGTARADKDGAGSDTTLKARVNNIEELFSKNDLVYEVNAK